MQRILENGGEKKQSCWQWVVRYSDPQFPQHPELSMYFQSSGDHLRGAAAKALFGEIAIHGKLPVTLPDVAKRGDGIDRNVAENPEHNVDQHIEGHMKILDWMVLCLYFLGMLGMGFWARTKVKTASDFFTAGGAMPWWLSGISHHYVPDTSSAESFVALRSHRC